MKLKYGARVYPLNSGHMLVKQTHQAEEGGKYVLSVDSDNRHPERHVREDDDAGIASAIRAALRGELGAKSE